MQMHLSEQCRCYSGAKVLLSFAGQYNLFRLYVVGMRKIEGVKLTSEAMVTCITFIDSPDNGCTGALIGNEAGNVSLYEIVLGKSMYYVTGKPFL